MRASSTYHPLHSSHLIIGDPSSGLRQRQCGFDALLDVRGLLFFCFNKLVLAFSLFSALASLDIAPRGKTARCEEPVVVVERKMEEDAQQIGSAV